MDDQVEIKPEAAVKFFVSLSSAAIGLIGCALHSGGDAMVVAASKHIVRLGPYLFGGCVSISLLFFFSCLFRAGTFYYHAARGEEDQREHAIQCARLCLWGLQALSISSVIAIVGIIIALLGREAGTLLFTIVFGAYVFLVSSKLAKRLPARNR